MSDLALCKNNMELARDAVIRADKIAIQCIQASMRKHEYFRDSEKKYLNELQITKLNELANNFDQQNDKKSLKS